MKTYNCYISIVMTNSIYESKGTSQTGGAQMKKLFTFALAAMVAASVAFAADGEKKEEKKEIKYVGDKQCKSCHGGIDTSVEVWEKSKHAEAFATLSGDEAKKHSKEATKDAKCLGCHVTGYGKADGWAADMEEKKRLPREAVTCESCHGPGQKYVSIMVQAMGGEKYDAKAAAEAGLVTPNEKTCVTCHNKTSPGFKEFKFAEMVKKIKHEKKAEEK